MRTSFTVDALLAGKVAPLGRAGAPSGIAKRRIESAYLGYGGLEGDEQADLRHHGGPEKALHHYAFEHYASWRKELPQPPALLASPGAFGENISTTGLTENEVCVGDNYLLGEAVIEVSQARQPCWKLNLRFAHADMARRVQMSCRTGWYYRILRPGLVSRGGTLKLVTRPNPEWPLARLLNALYVNPLDFKELEQMAELKALPVRWRELAMRRLSSRTVENWDRRLGDELDAQLHTKREGSSSCQS